MLEGWSDIQRQGQLCIFARYYVKVALVFWIATTHVILEFLYTTFGLILLLRNTFKLTEVFLRPNYRCLFKDCDDLAFGDNDDDCFYYHSWRNNVVIAFGTLSSFLT